MAVLTIAAVQERVVDRLAVFEGDDPKGSYSIFACDAHHASGAHAAIRLRVSPLRMRDDLCA